MHCHDSIHKKITLIWNMAPRPWFETVQFFVSNCGPATCVHPVNIKLKMRYEYDSEKTVESNEIFVVEIRTKRKSLCAFKKSTSFILKIKKRGNFPFFSPPHGKIFGKRKRAVECIPFCKTTQVDDSPLRWSKKIRILYVGGLYIYM